MMEQTDRNLKCIIAADPVSSLMDDKIELRVRFLPPGHLVTLAGLLEEDGVIFTSYAHYVASSNGTVDVWKDPSTGGTYKGVEPMGLLWSLTLCPGQRLGIRLIRRDVTTALTVHISVIPGHVIIGTKDQFLNHTPLAQTFLKKSYMGPGVQKIPVREGRLRGTLFIPPGKGPFPGVIDMFGGTGGLIEFRAALLASRGFTSFSLAYTDYDDLPKDALLEMEYFEEAVDWFSTHPAVLPPWVGVVGVSKGAELAAFMAIHRPQVKAVVGIGGMYYRIGSTHNYKGKEFPIWYPTTIREEDITPDGVNPRYMMWHGDIPAETQIPFEKAENAHFLFVHGTEDQSADIRHQEKMVARLRAHGKSNYTALCYPGAGHLIEPPYAPMCTVSYLPRSFEMAVVFGGQLPGHAKAQEDSWQKILHFLKEHLMQHHSTYTGASSKM